MSNWPESLDTADQNSGHSQGIDIAIYSVDVLGYHLVQGMGNPEELGRTTQLRIRIYFVFFI